MHEPFSRKELHPRLGKCVVQVFELHEGRVGCDNGISALRITRVGVVRLGRNWKGLGPRMADGKTKREAKWNGPK